MTMCVISHFKVGNTVLVVDKATKAATPNSSVVDELMGYSVIECSLTEEFLKPHEFKFTLRRDLIKKSDKSKNFTIVENIIGKKVECTVETKLGGRKNSKMTFHGSVVSTAMKGLDISCVALSEDADLQDSPKSRSFTDIKLENLVNSILPAGSKVSVHACFKNLKFPYIVQYNESDYDFLVRLAKRFGLFFYRNHGVNNPGEMVFGKLPKTKNIDVVTIADPNVAGVSYELNTSSPNFKLVSHYDAKSLDVSSNVVDFDRGSTTNIFKMAANGSSVKADSGFFYDYPDALPINPAPDNVLMDNINKAMIGSLSSGLAICKFTCFVFTVGVGDVVTVKDGNKMVVTSAKLSWDCNGSPQNEVTAMMLPADSTTDENIFAPYFDFNAYPKSSAQRAEVFNNADPDKMGRVQVFFSWQKDLTDAEKGKLPWIRIAQPYGGSEKGKGFYLIPEKKEEVMVGFEHENMEKPFVIGTLFHDSDDAKKKQLPDGEWGEKTDDPKANEENEVKAFRTKNGHTIEFHDTKQGDGFIRIYGNNNSDKENYDIILSTDKIQKVNGQKKEDYIVKSADDAAKDDEDIKEKDHKAFKLRVLVRSNGGDIMLDAGDGDIIMNARNIRIHASGDETSYVEGNNILKVNGAQRFDLNTNSLLVQEGQTIEVKGCNKEKYCDDVSIEASKEFELKAKKLSTDTSDKTYLKASGQFEIDATKETKVSSQSGLNLNCGSKVEMKGSSVTIEAQANAALKGVQVNVEAEGVNTVKGTSVMLDASASGTRKGTWTDM